MKVTGQQPPRPSDVNGGKAREAEQRAARQRPAEENSPTRLQHQARLTTHKLREAVRTAGDVRANRVAELKERLEAGKYEIDPDRLAANLLNESIREDVDKP